MASPVKPNAATQKSRDDRAAINKAAAAARATTAANKAAAMKNGKQGEYVRVLGPARYQKPVTAPAAAPSRLAATRASGPAAKPKVNKQTQAIRDDRAEAKSKGYVYKRSVTPGSAAAKTRAAMGVNEVLMNRRLTIRTAAKKRAAAKAKADTPKDAETGNANAESEQQGNTQASNTTASTPPKVETEMEKARRLRKEAEAAAGK